MIKRLVFILMFSTLIFSSYSTDFISQWNTSVSTGNVTNSTQIKLPLESVGTYNFYVNWGDGTNNTITVWNQTETTHNYATAGVKTVRINGTIIGFVFNYTGDRDKILNIEQWGDLRVGNSTSYFYGCSNLNSNATDALNLTGTTTLAVMFASATNFNGNINTWDVSKVTTMVEMFDRAGNFNQPLNTWDVSSVTDMAWMFYWASQFNQSLSNWNTSSVTDMSSMFKRAWVFNQPLNNWNVSKVANMFDMFSEASSFNQDLTNWNTSSVTNMRDIFYLASNFNGNISTWDVSHVTTMESMFRDTNFNRDISNWNTSSVTEMYKMFNGATNFNQNISAWNTTQVTGMYGMFNGAINFNQNISAWDVSKVIYMGDMFYGATNFNQNISAWDVSKVGYMNNMFRSATNFNQNLTSWCVPTLSAPFNFATSSPLDSNGMKPIWGTCPNRELTLSYTNFSEGVINVNYTYIRADANTNINSCKLNWNGTWFNMTRGGSYCYLNKTGTFNNTYSYYVEANRSNVFNVTSTKIVTMQEAVAIEEKKSGFNLFPVYGVYSIIITFSLLIVNFIFN